VLNRIALLTNAEAEDSLHVVQISRGVETGKLSKLDSSASEAPVNGDQWPDLGVAANQPRVSRRLCLVF